MNFHIVRFNQLVSTNTEALLNDYPEGSVILARYQTCGRGQRGNTWNSNASENLTFSVVCFPRRPIVDSYPISMAAALSVVETLGEYGIEAKIKWPNDIYSGDLKIAGILIENSTNSDCVITKSVVGIGLNVCQRTFPESVPNPTSMLLCGVIAEPEEVLGKFLDTFNRICQLDDGTLYRKYLDSLWRKEGYHPYEDSNGPFFAKINNVNPHTGRLTLQRKDGRLSEYYFKEVQALLR